MQQLVIQKIIFLLLIDFLGEGDDDQEEGGSEDIDGHMELINFQHPGWQR